MVIGAAPWMELSCLGGEQLDLGAEGPRTGPGPNLLVARGGEVRHRDGTLPQVFILILYMEERFGWGIEMSLLHS